MTIVNIFRPTEHRDTWLVYATTMGHVRHAEPVHDGRIEFPADQELEACAYAQDLAKERVAHRIHSD